MLLERDGELEVLEGALDRAARARGLRRARLRRSGHRQDEPGARVPAGRGPSRDRAAGRVRRPADPAHPRTLRDAARTGAARWPPRSPTATGTRCWPPSSPSWAGPGRPCSCSRTSTGPTTRPSTSCATSAAGGRARRRRVTFRDGEVGRSLQRSATACRPPARSRATVGTGTAVLQKLRRWRAMPPPTPRPRPLTPAKRRLAVSERRLSGNWRRREIGDSPCTRSETGRHENGDSPSARSETRRSRIARLAVRESGASAEVSRASRSPCGRRTGTGRRGRPSASTRRGARPRPRPAGARAAAGGRSRCPAARR